MREAMNYDSTTDAGQGIAQKNERIHRGRRSDRQIRERVVSLVGRLLVVLAVVLAVAWVGAVVVPAFGGLLAAAVVGFVALWALPWLVVTGVVSVFEHTE